MQEAAEGRLVLEHVPSGAFRAILEFVFLGHFGLGGTWCRATGLPFRADKWSFGTAQLLNYLFLIGGYRERRGARGFAFRMAAFRYNPLAGCWQPTAPLLQASVPCPDTWQELFPTLTRADADLPGLYFLGGSEPLYVVGGNAQENVVISFSPGARRWGPAWSLPKCSRLYMVAPELGSLPCCPLPTPPFPLSYEALFFLHFPLPPPPGGELGTERGQAGARGPRSQLGQ
ncbi:unnamed protein product [Caretta caretta]